MHNAYDVPYEDARESLQALKDKGYRLIIVSSRPTDTIREWLDKYEMSHFFDDVSNIKHPAKYYIDDHAIRFERKLDNPWKNVLEFIDYEEKK